MSHLVFRCYPGDLDATARDHQYDGVQTAITYRGDPNPQFSAEGDALFA
jgi:hypothetical protein